MFCSKCGKDLSATPAPNVKKPALSKGMLALIIGSGVLLLAKEEVEAQIAEAKEAASLQLDAENLKQMRKELRIYLAKADVLEVRQFLLTVVREIIVNNQNITFMLNIA